MMAFDSVFSAIIFIGATMVKWRLDAGQIEVIDDDVADMLRRKTPAERIQMIGDCNETMRQLIEGAIRTFNPEWNDALVGREVARRMSRETA